VPWLDNDAVNLAGSSIGAIVAALGWQLVPH
jgi:predicted acylesterase/phospholipase RssA